MQHALYAVGSPARSSLGAFHNHIFLSRVVLWSSFRISCIAAALDVSTLVGGVVFARLAGCSIRSATLHTCYFPAEEEVLPVSIQDTVSLIDLEEHWGSNRDKDHPETVLA